VTNIISSVTSDLPTSKNTEETTTSIESTSSQEIVPASTTEEKTVDQPEPSSTGLFGIMKSLLPSGLRSKVSHEISSEEEIPSEDVNKKTVSSSTSKTILTTVDEDGLLRTTYPADEVSQQDEITSNIHHADKQPVVIEKEIVVLEPFEESKTKVEVSEQPPSTESFETMKNILPSNIQHETSSTTRSEEQIPFVDEHTDVTSSSRIETTTESKVSEENLMQSTQLVTELQQQESVSSQLPSETTTSDINDTDKQAAEQITEDKDSVGIMSKLTSVVTDAISAIQSALPTPSTSSTDAQQEKSPVEGDEIEVCVSVSL
jgi:hypothetical protein